MKFFIIYAALSLSDPISLDLTQEVIPNLKIYKSYNLALNPFDDSTPEEKKLQQMGYLTVENNIQVNYLIKSK